MPWSDKDALTPQALNSRSGLVFNVADPDYGAVADGTTDDTTAIQAAISAASTAGGGIVQLSTGTHLVSAPLKVPTEVWLRGNGHAATTIKLADSANTDIILSAKFWDNTNTNNWLVEDGVEYGMGFVGFRIDGNNTSNNTGTGLKLYAKNYVIDDLSIRSCGADGFYSEGGNASGQNDWFDTPESRVLNLWSSRNSVNGVRFRGPHDAMFGQIISNGNIHTGFQTETSSGSYSGAGTLINQLHTFSNGTGVHLAARGAQIGVCETDAEKTRNCVISEKRNYISIYKDIGAKGDSLTFDSSGIECSVGQMHVLSATSDTKALTVDGTGVRIGTAILEGSDLSAQAIQVNANGFMLSNGYIFDYQQSDDSAGVGVEVGGTGAANDCNITATINNCDTAFLYTNAGNDNRITLRTTANSGQTAVDPTQAPTARDRFDIVTAGSGNSSTQARGQSATFAIDSTGVKTVTITHGLLYRPNAADVQLTVRAMSEDDWEYDWVELDSRSTTAFSARVKVGTASVTGGATATLNWRAKIGA